MGRITELCSRFSSDYVVSRGQQSGDDQIQGVGGVITKAQALGCVFVPAEEPGEALAELVQQRARFYPEIKSASPRIDAGRTIEIQHEMVDVFRLWPRSRGVIEINQVRCLCHD